MVRRDARYDEIQKVPNKNTLESEHIDLIKINRSGGTVGPNQN